MVRAFIFDFIVLTAGLWAIIPVEEGDVKSILAKIECGKWMQ